MLTSIRLVEQLIGSAEFMNVVVAFAMVAAASMAT